MTKIMKMKNLEKGYVIVSRETLNKLFEKHREATGYEEAYLRVLINVNYKSETCQWNGQTLVCKRGEAIYTYAQWAELLGWTRSRTIYFFRRMFNEKLIRHVESVCPMHICLNDLEGGESGEAASVNESAGKRPGENGFSEFWEKYHLWTQTDKVNKERARHIWRKLSPEERKLAFDNIEEFSYHHPETRFCPQAARYLADKSFNDEYFN